MIKQKQRLANAESETKAKDIEIVNLKKMLEETKQIADTNLHQRLEIFNIEKEKEILVIKKEHHQKMEECQQYTDKIKELLDVIEKMQNPGTTKKASTRIIKTDD